MRKIEPKLVSYIEKKLAGNGLYNVALESKDARTLVVLAAQALVGVKEKTGNNDGEMVRLIQETYGNANGEPWCMSLAQSCIAFAEVKTGKKSPVVAGELCSAVWRDTPKAQRVKYLPLAGALMIFIDVNTRTGKDKISGHVEIVLSSDGKTVQCIGGNTSGTTKPGHAVNREGNGCYYTVRSAKGTASRRVAGYLKPF